MAGTPSEDDDNSQPTFAGCVLLVLSVAVIGVVALALVTWRDPETGRPLPRMVAIIAPVLAGAICYGIGSGLLRMLGLAVLVKPKKESPERDRQTPDESDGAADRPRE